MAEAAFDELWRLFDREYPMFVLRPEVNWAKLRDNSDRCAAKVAESSATVKADNERGQDPPLHPAPLPIGFVKQHCHGYLALEALLSSRRSGDGPGSCLVDLGFRVLLARRSAC
jgi:hypothetical protein